MMKLLKPKRVWLKGIGRFAAKWLFVGAVLGGCGYLLMGGAPSSSTDEASTKTTSVTDDTTDASKTTDSNPLKRVVVTELKSSPISVTITLPGIVEAIDDIDLAASIAGTVEWVGVVEGERVKKNQPLFRIDLRSRQALYEDSQAAHELAQRTRDRLSQLKSKGSGLVSPESLDQAETSLRRAQFALKLAETGLSLGQILSPISGYVDRIDMDKGEFAQEGTPLAHLVRIETVKVMLGVAERDVDAVAHQKTANVRIDALDREFQGRIEHVAYAANLQTNTFETTIVIENKDRLIRPGMIAHATLVTKEMPNALTVPLFALMNTLDGPTVFVEEDGVARSVPIEIASIRGAEVVVASGLQPGQRIVTKGQRDLADGQELEVVLHDGTLSLR